MKFKNRILFVFIILHLFIYNIYAEGLKTEFSELLLENLQIGTTYSFKNDFNYPLIIEYTGSDKSELYIKPSSPKRGKPEFKLIPSLNWVKIKPDFFIVKPDQKIKTDIIISIPDDPELIGNKYAFGIRSFTKPVKGQFMGVGVAVNSTVMFTIISKTKKYLKKNIKKPSMDFQLNPLHKYIKNISVGKNNKENKGIIEIINNDKSPHTYIITTLKVRDTSAKLKPGYKNFPDLSFIKFKKNKIRIKSNRFKKIYYSINFPDKKKYKNQKYMFIISVEDANSRIMSSSRYARVYVHTARD